MTEDQTLATLTLVFLLVISAGCCLGIWYKMRREDE